ncbi:MAG: AAA family ATPase [Deltaproteobacteria bacterium]
MIPIKLSLSNFLSYGEAVPSLDFTGFSLACLSGANGHGKSALIDAITWALWGRCRVKAKDEVIRRGQSEARVEFEFEAEGVRYRALRSIKKRAGGSAQSVEFQVFDPGPGVFRVVESGAKVQGAIEKTLKMGYESFVCSSFILQGRADEFTKKPPSERKEILASILGLETYETLSRAAREQANLHKIKEEGFASELLRIEPELSMRDKLLSLIEEARARESEAEGKLSLAEREYEAVIAQIQALRADEARRASLAEGRGVAEAAAASLRGEAKRLGSAINEAGKLAARKGEIEDGFALLRQAAAEESILSDKLINHTALRAELDALLRGIADARSRLESQLEGHRGAASEMQKRLCEVEEYLRQEGDIARGFEALRRVEGLLRECQGRKAECEGLAMQKFKIAAEIQKARLLVESEIRESHKTTAALSQKASRREDFRSECERLRAGIASKLKTQSEAEAMREGLAQNQKSAELARSRLDGLLSREQEESDKLRVVESHADRTHCPLCDSELGREAKLLLEDKLRLVVGEIRGNIEYQRREISRLQAEGSALAGRIESAEREAESSALLNEKLWKAESLLQEAVSALGELEIESEKEATLCQTLESGDFARAAIEEMRRVEAGIEYLAYDEARHLKIAAEAESLRHFEALSINLQREKSAKSQIEADVQRSEEKIKSLQSAIDAGHFAPDSRDRASQVEDEIQREGYDEAAHKNLRVKLSELRKYQSEKNALEGAERDLSRLEGELSRTLARLDSEAESLARIDAEMEKLAESLSRRGAAEQRQASVQGEMSRLKSLREGALTEKIQLASELEKISRLALRRDELTAASRASSRAAWVYRELDRAFGRKGIQALIIEGAVPEIDNEANRILRKLTDGAMALSIELQRAGQRGGEIETLDIKISDSAGTRSYESYSGGEAFRIDFALRVAISKFIANRSGASLRTLVVDEGFGTQDRDGLGQFVQVIGAIRDDFDKILVITHVEELKDRFPVRIEVHKESGKGSSFEVIYL